MSTVDEPRRRRGDSLLGKLSWLWANLIPVVAVALATWAVIGAAHEGDVRTRQFCSLTLGTHADRVARYRTTVAYLRSPAGREHTLFNEYVVKVSLPQTRKEIAREAELIPQVCRELQQHKQ